MKKSKRRQKNNSPQTKDKSTSPKKEINLSNITEERINNDSKSLSREIWRNFAQRYSTKLTLNDAMKVSQLEVKFDELTEKRITKIFNKWKFRYKWRLFITSQIKKSNINNLHKYIQRYRFTQRQKWIHYSQFLFKLQKEDSFYDAIVEYQEMKMVYNCFSKWYKKFDFINSGRRDLIIKWKDFKQRLLVQNIEDRVNEILDEEEIREKWKKFFLFLRKDSIQHSKERDELLQKWHEIVGEYVKYDKRNALEDGLNKMEQRAKWNDFFLIVRKNELRRVRQEDFNNRNEKRMRHAFYVWSYKFLSRSSTKRESRHVFLDSVSAYTYSAANQSAYLIQQFYKENKQRIFNKKYLLTKYFFNWALRLSTSVTSQLLNDTPPLETDIENPIDQNISNFVSIDEGNVVSTLSRIYYYKHKNEVYQQQQQQEALQKQRALQMEEESSDEDLDQNVVKIHDPNENKSKKGTNLRFVDATTVTSKTSFVNRHLQLVHIPDTVESEPSPKFKMIEECSKDIKEEMNDIFTKRFSPFVVHLEILALQSFGSVTLPEKEDTLSLTLLSKTLSPQQDDDYSFVSYNTQKQVTPKPSSVMKRRRKKKTSPTPKSTSTTISQTKSPNIRVTSQFFKATPLYATQPLKQEEEATKSLRRKKKRSPKKEDLAQTEPLKKRKKIKVKKSPAQTNVIPPENSDDDPFKEHDSDALYTPQTMRRRQFFSETLPDKKEKRKKSKKSDANAEEQLSSNTFSLQDNDSSKYFSETEIHKKKVSQKPPPPLESPAPLQDKPTIEEEPIQQQTHEGQEDEEESRKSTQQEAPPSQDKPAVEEEKPNQQQKHEEEEEEEESRKSIQQEVPQSQDEPNVENQNNTNQESAVVEEEEKSEETYSSPLMKLLNMSFKQAIVSTAASSIAQNFYGFDQIQSKRSLHRFTHKRMSRVMLRISKEHIAHNEEPKEKPQLQQEQQPEEHQEQNNDNNEHSEHNEPPQEQNEEESHPNQTNTDINFSLAPPRGGVDLTIQDLDEILGPDCIIDTVKDIFSRIEPFLPFDPIKPEKHVNFKGLQKDDKDKSQSKKHKTKESKKDNKNSKKDEKQKDLISSTFDESFNKSIEDLSKESIEKQVQASSNFFDVYFNTYPYN